MGQLEVKHLGQLAVKQVGQYGVKHLGQLRLKWVGQIGVKLPSSILSIENYVYYLNQFDFKVIRFSKRDLISGIVNPTQITIPISNIRKPRDLSSSEVAGMDIASTVSAMRNAHAINGFYNVGSKIMFFQVYSSTESKYSLFVCKFDLNQLTNCKVLANLGSFEMIAHVDERQMITTSYNVDDESTILRKYNIIY